MSTPKQHGDLSSATGAPPEKSKFMQTCNRLSLFLKEKGKNNIRHLQGTGLFDSVTSQINPNSTSEAKPTTTVDFLSTIDEKEKPTSQVADDNNIPPDQYVLLDSSCELAEEEDNKGSPVGKPKSSAQMTIFYQGQVLVLDDVPADRARDLILLAKKGSVDDVSRSKEKEKEPKDSDLPIARRASLHKFLAKRKDRATVRAPYHSPSPGASSSGNEHSFDLNL